MSEVMEMVKDIESRVVSLFDFMVKKQGSEKELRQDFARRGISISAEEEKTRREALLRD